MPTPARLALLTLALTTAPAWAQPAQLEAKAPLQKAFDVQLDPTPFFLKGLAPEVGVTLGRHRLLATVIVYDVPGFLAEDAKFNERRVIPAVGYEYFFLGHLDGLFAGLTLSLVSSTFTLRETGTARDTLTFKATARVGWLVAPFRAVPGLFFAPWVGSSFSVAPQAFTVDEVAITRKLVGFTAALQVGWKFCL